MCPYVSSYLWKNFHLESAKPKWDKRWKNISVSLKITKGKHTRPWLTVQGNEIWDFSDSCRWKNEMKQGKCRICLHCSISVAEVTLRCRARICWEQGKSCPPSWSVWYNITSKHWCFFLRAHAVIQSQCVSHVLSCLAHTVMHGAGNNKMVWFSKSLSTENTQKHTLKHIIYMTTLCMCVCQVCWGLHCLPAAYVLSYESGVTHMYVWNYSDIHSHGQNWPLETPCGAFGVELHYILTYSRTDQQCHVCSVNCPVSQCFLCHIVLVSISGCMFPS